MCSYEYEPGLIEKMLDVCANNGSLHQPAHLHNLVRTSGPICSKLYEVIS